MNRMKTMKRFVLVVFGMLTAMTVNAGDDVTIDGVVYSLWPNENAASVKDGSKFEGKELHLPAVIDNGGTKYPLKTIGGEAFKDCKGIEKIVIPEGVTTIHMRAFSGCSGLKSVVIPRSLTAFYSNRVFAGCSSLQQIVFPSANVRIYIDGEYTIAMSIVNGFNNTFEGCTSLETFIIGSADGQLSSMPVMASAFTGCTALRLLVVLCQPNSGYPYDPAGEDLNDRVTLVVPDSVVDAYRNTEWASRLAAIQPFSEFVQDGFSAPFGDDMRYTYTADNRTLTVTGNGAMLECGEAGHYHNGVWFSEGYLYAPWECVSSLMEHVVIDDGVTRVGRCAFQNDGGLASVTIGKTVEEIGESAFKNCKSLTELTIPASVKSISEGAFIGCYGLKTIKVEDGNPIYDSREDCNAIIETATGTLLYGSSQTVVPDGVKTIDAYAFFNTGVTKADLPASVTTIGKNAFRDCRKLASVTIPKGVAEISQQAFYGCNGMTKLTIEDGVKVIGIEAFKGCSSLPSLTIPASVRKLDMDAFYECGGLKDLTIENGVDSICGGAFCYCKSLTSVTLPSSVTYAGSLFKGCSSLKDVHLSEGLTSLASSFFSDCTSLQTITIPMNITKLGGSLFKGCTALASITCRNPQPPVCDFSTFDGVDFTIPLYVPKGSVLKYKAADGWRNFVIIREAAEGEESQDIWLTVNDGARGSLRLKIDEARPYVTLQFVAEEGWYVYSVMLDEEDVTAEISVDGTYTTPAINADTRLTVVYAEGSTGLTRIYTDSQPEVKVTDDGLMLNNLSEGDRVEVYTLDGHRVYTSKATGAHAEIPVAPNKVYIVRINDQTFKVCL